MNYHITFYQLNFSMEEVQIRQIIDVLNSFEALTTKVPGIIKIQVGKVRQGDGNEYSHCILVEAENVEAIQAYKNNEDRKQLTQKLESYEKPHVAFGFVTKKDI